MAEHGNFVVELFAEGGEVLARGVEHGDALIGGELGEGAAGADGAEADDVVFFTCGFEDEAGFDGCFHGVLLGAGRCGVGWRPPLVPSAVGGQLVPSVGTGPAGTLSRVPPAHPTASSVVMALALEEAAEEHGCCAPAAVPAPADAFLAVLAEMACWRLAWQGGCCEGQEEGGGGEEAAG